MLATAVAENPTDYLKCEFWEKLSVLLNNESEYIRNATQWQMVSILKFYYIKKKPFSIFISGSISMNQR